MVILLKFRTGEFGFDIKVGLITVKLRFVRLIDWKLVASIELFVKSNNNTSGNSVRNFTSKSKSNLYIGDAKMQLFDLLLVVDLLVSNL